MGLTEIALIMFVALILFGPEDLPVIARTLGKIMFQVRKITNEIGKEFNDAINTPGNVVNEALKDTPAKKNTPKSEKEEEDTEELLTLEEITKKVSADNTTEGKNPLEELPSAIVSSPKDKQAGE